MAIRTLLIVFVVLEPNVLLFNFAYAGCVFTRLSKVECDSVTELSDLYFNGSLDNFQDVKTITITKNGSELFVYRSAFRNFTNLESINVEFSRIRRIYKGTFQNMPLKTVFLDYDGIEKILPGSFHNLPFLQKLSVSNNRLETIPKGVLKDLPELTYLSLSKNKISFIEDSALENLPRLNKLQLDNNKIETVSIHKILSYPEQLEILWLHNNSLTLVSNYMLQKLTKLKLLNLGFNKISMIEVNAFEQVPELTTLVLTHNRLKEVDGNVFPARGLDNLEKLYLDNNELMFLSSRFFFRLNDLRRITLVGNPWSCACLDVIKRILVENSIEEKCQDLFVTGKRPICVAESATNKVCKYTYNNELRETYMDYKKRFPLYVTLVSCYL